MSYTTKCDLYRAINRFRSECLLERTDNVAAECERRGWAKVIEYPFATIGLKGMSYLARSGCERNIIMLRKALSREEKNFTCAHELIHVKFHNNLHIATFQCFDKIRPNQNSILEWQANEGAAELLVPLCEFLPIIKENLPGLKTWQDFESFDFELARYFSTTNGVIKIRYEDLKYEIYQYLNEVPLDRIEILSRKMQRSRGIRVESLNDIEDRLWQKEFGNYHIDIVAEGNHVEA